MVDKTIIFGTAGIINIILLFVSSTSELAVNEAENIDIGKVNLVSTLFAALLIITSLLCLIIFYRKIPSIEKSK